MPPPAASYPAQAGDDALLEEMRQRFRTSSRGEADRRSLQEFDYKFSIGLKSETESYQWNEADKAARAGRPMLTNNLIAGQIRRLTNQQRESLQSIRVNPIDNGADPEKAEIRQGVIRHIEAQSDADVAYMTAADQQVRMGEGYVRVYPQYVSDDPQNPEQELVIEAIENRFAVYSDPAGKKLTGSDDRYKFICEDLEDSEYAKRYPNSLLVGLSEFSGIGDYQADWFLKGAKRIAEYFYVESTWTKVKVTNKDGQPDERDMETRRICWIKTNGVEVLLRRKLPPAVKWIPVVRAAGEKTLVEGKVDFRGVVRDSIHPQKMVNYLDSAEAEMIALGSKAPYEGYTGQFKDAKLKTVNTKNHPYVEFEPTVPNVPGLLPIPKRNVSEPPIQALVLAGQRAENKLRATLGVIDVESQERRREQSGKAITARERQSENANSHYVRNLGLMIRQIGRVVNAWMPAIYDTPRVMQIIGSDEQPQTVMVHAGQAPPQGQQPPNAKVLDLTDGRYDIAIHEGPSAPTARLEAVDNMAQVIAADPTQLKVMGDLFYGSMDSEWARKLAKRYEKLIPAELRGDGNQPDPQQLQQQLQQMGQVMQHMTQELEAKNEYIKTEGIKLEHQLQLKQSEFSHDEKMAEIENAAKIRVAEINAAVKGYVEEAAHAAEHEQQALGQHHEARMAAATTGAQTDEAQRQREHDAEQGELGHQRTLEQNAQVAALTPQPEAGA